MAPQGIRSPLLGEPGRVTLSLYLFLRVEGLSTLINNANSLGHLTDIQFEVHSPCISHLLFVDDSLIFLKSSKSECLTLKGLIEFYGKASRQCINFSKSALLFSPNVHPERHKYLQTIHVNLVNDFGNILGCLLTSLDGKVWTGISSKTKSRKLCKDGSIPSF